MDVPSRRRVPGWLWLLLAPGMVLAQVGAKLIGEPTYRRWMRGELGIVENSTVVLLVVACVCALASFRLRERVASRLFGPFALVMALGCFFFAGEEASWGQHWLGYATPEGIAERNEQGEFNLHNDPFLETFLDQLPRNLLTLAALVGGLLGPILRRKRSAFEPDFGAEGVQRWIWPPAICWPAALLAVTITLPAKILEGQGREVPYLLEISAGETKEFALALFLTVYLLHMLVALRNYQPRSYGYRS